MSISKIVPIDVLISEGKCIKIDTDKLKPFGRCSFELFKGERLAEMIESVKRFGVCHPITVRHCNDGNYEIINGHYRVAACKSLEMESIPAIIKQLNDEEALDCTSNSSPLGLLLRNGIDIYDKDYKKSENYQKMEGARVISDDNFNMALDEYIERFLLKTHDVIKTYESIYDMGNPYELDDNECEYSFIAHEIIKIIMLEYQEYILELESQNYKSYGDQVEIRKTLLEQEFYAKKLMFVFDRPGGYIEQLKVHLNLDLDSFDNGNIRNRREKAKILYFLYMLKNRDFPKIKVLQLLSKPSMENIDNSFLGWETSNGRFIRLIKHSFEKELSLDRRTAEEKEDPFGPAEGGHAKNNIKSAVAHVVESWGRYISNRQNTMIYMAESGYDYGFDDEIASLKSALSESPKPTLNIGERTPTLSPIETLYLKVLQQEGLGQIIDAQMVHRLQSNKEYDVPLEYIEEMKKIHRRNNKVSNVEKYLDDKSPEIAKYVFLKPTKNSDKYRQIREKTGHVKRFLSFCIKKGIYNNTEEDISELLIISCLQAVFLDDKKEEFEYAFHGSQGTEGNRKGKIYVQAALKNDNYTHDALKVYWVHKVMDRLYANIGKCELKCKFRELVILCFDILGNILDCPDIKQMLKLDSYYHKAVFH